MQMYVPAYIAILIQAHLEASLSMVQWPLLVLLPYDSCSFRSGMTTETPASFSLTQ